ncbi:hypothetical protein SAMN05192532_102498 [Alteribacillus iranensis]|uniref:Uncharacterized protein n=2 Tax=Alteribacillus iranensis TaxID=930128 RepID=A0A1I2BTI5_9BACI|nr:hypothetical protein SAMN05192532_102498 [Alteribacillus iranensis]
MFQASIKKIEIVNKTVKKEWHQSVRVILEDIELNNDNFLALRKFRPDEVVQVTMDAFKRKPSPANVAAEIMGEELPGVEEERELDETDIIEREFKLSSSRDDRTRK